MARESPHGAIPKTELQSQSGSGKQNPTLLRVPPILRALQGCIGGMEGELEKLTASRLAAASAAWRGAEARRVKCVGGTHFTARPRISFTEAVCGGPARGGEFHFGTGGGAASPWCRSRWSENSLHFSWSSHSVCLYGGVESLKARVTVAGMVPPVIPGDSYNPLRVKRLD